MNMTDPAGELVRLKSCSNPGCQANGRYVQLNRGCKVHGGLANWIFDNTDPRIADKAAEYARNSERLAETSSQVKEAVAEFAAKMADLFSKR